jgi:hypothetical protein
MRQDERYGRLSRDARELFNGLITMADDEGRLMARPAAIVGHCFPFDDDAEAHVGEWLGEIVAAGMVVSYERANVPYLAFRHWRRHQRINRATPSMLPAPPSRRVAIENRVPEADTSRPKRDISSTKPRQPSDKEATERRTGRGRSADSQNGGIAAAAGNNEHEKSLNEQRALTDDAQLPRGSDPVPSLSLSASSSSSSLNNTIPVESERFDDARTRLRGNDVQAVFDAWIAATGRTGQTQLDDKRRRIITRALKSHGLDDCLDAVTGWRHDPHNRGENDRGRPYNDIGLLLRDSEHIERFRDLQRGAGRDSRNDTAAFVQRMNRRTT